MLRVHAVEVGSRLSESHRHYDVRHKDQEILPIPPGDVWVVPNRRARVVGNKAMLYKPLSPPTWPLAVNMTGTSLRWYRGAEQDDRSMPGQTLDELLSFFGRKMLGHLKARHEIKFPAEIETQREIASLEPLPWNNKAVLRHMITIEAKEVIDAVSAEFTKPMAEPTADIKNRADSHRSKNQRDDNLGRAFGDWGPFVEELWRILIVHASLPPFAFG
jgi:hypothetical protein